MALPGGRFVMGTDACEGFAEDGEGPAREVEVSPFRIAPTAVTNAQFRAFVRATRYITDAEAAGSSFVFYLQVEVQRRAAIRQVSRELPWWLQVEGACWQRPAGAGSGIADRMDHPVVHISWNDAAAYCAWAGLRLPTEAEWEYAARGGLAQQRYPWGDAFEPGGERCCNTWQGHFPAQPAPGWAPGTVPADAFTPNGYGLHNMAGNAWEWCADWFSPTYHRTTAVRDPLQERATGRRSLRGGSFLCHESYCNRYRVAARGSNSPESSASNLGFRVAAPAAAAALQ
ncbi:formylglycine-generating enzyme family protein [Ramlibacter sp. AN1133]|uniref:formylglycine-generating enzyme family protein n=1 Tax=Ramlibacter sp. AN1133 TaxID=3133429 RepID=UPI0030C54F6E